MWTCFHGEEEHAVSDRSTSNIGVNCLLFVPGFSRSYWLLSSFPGHHLAAWQCVSLHELINFEGSESNRTGTLRLFSIFYFWGNKLEYTFIGLRQTTQNSLFKNYFGFCGLTCLIFFCFVLVEAALVCNQRNPWCSLSIQWQTLMLAIGFKNILDMHWQMWMRIFCQFGFRISPDDWRVAQRRMSYIPLTSAPLTSQWIVHREPTCLTRADGVAPALHVVDRLRQAKELDGVDG